MDLNTSHPVMVTGGTGYVGSWIVRRLLEQGLTVHATVRDPANKARTAHLTALADDNPGSIRYFRADLLEPGSFAEAMQGCAIVFHTASPFTNTFDDPQKELVDPAVKGTRNVLEQANATDSVTRVVLTSSCAAIYCDAADCADAPGGVLSEDIWNTRASLTHGQYALSKTLAEKAAWQIAEAQDRWRLVVINPSFVLGPGVQIDLTAESMSMMKQFGDGAFRSGAPRWGTGIVDVRDVAEAHLRAAFLPDAAGRHIVSGTNTDFLEVARTLSEKYGDSFPLPTKALPKFLVWLLGPMVNKAMTRRSVARSVNHAWRADTTKSIEKLGLTYRPMKQTLEDMFQQMIDEGVLKPD